MLVADDDRINQMLMHKQLALLGVDYSIVDNGKAAFDYLEQHGDDVAILITDCHMPDMDGFELTETIKGQSSSINFCQLLDVQPKILALWQKKLKNVVWMMYCINHMH